VFDDLDDQQDAYVADTFGGDPSSFASPASDAGGGLLDRAASALSGPAHPAPPRKARALRSILLRL
jgi:hypothetical protein